MIPNGFIKASNLSSSFDEPVNSKIAKSCPTSTEVAFDSDAFSITDV